MYKDMINSRVTVLVSSRGETVLEYVGTLTNEDDKSIMLSEVDVSYLMLNFQKGIFGDSMSRYKQGLGKVVINKRYIISCNN